MRAECRVPTPSLLLSHTIIMLHPTTITTTHKARTMAQPAPSSGLLQSSSDHGTHYRYRSCLHTPSPTGTRTSTPAGAASLSLSDHDTMHSNCSSSSTRSSSGSGSRTGRKVSFTHVDIVELSVELGHHPSCRTGPPLQLGRSVAQERQRVPFQEFEQERSPHRRSLPQLYLSSEDRKKLLHLEVVRRQQHEEDDNQEGETVLLLSNKNEEMDRRLDQIDHRVDSLLARMDSFDQILMGASSRRKQRERRRERRRASMIY